MRTKPLLRHGRWLLPVFLAFCSLAPAGSAQTIIVVRHAERAGGTGPEVGLSKAGQLRAQVLAAMLADAGVKHIYTSEVARTQQTAEPLATRLGLHAEVVAANDYDGLIAKLRAGGSAGAALVVGHSNTVPEIVSRLGGGAVPPIEDNEFDRLYVVTLTGANRASVVLLRYPGATR
ncbi:MAG TPA: phosphoglycerate mutase family protein [Bryobacteraceae bacterium]